MGTKKRHIFKVLALVISVFTSVFWAGLSSASSIDTKKTSMTLSIFQDPGRLDVVTQAATSLIL